MLHAGRIVSAASARAEHLAELDHRVPRGPARAGGGPKLAESFRFDRAPRRRGKRLVVKARNVAPHARYTVDGTMPHVIVPRRARALRFEVDGQVVFARVVSHPGNDRSSWWDDMLADVWPQSLQAVALLL